MALRRKCCGSGECGERGRRVEVGAVDACPGVDDGRYLGGFKVGKCLVVCARECQDVAFALHGLNLEETRCKALTKVLACASLLRLCEHTVSLVRGFVVLLRLFDGAIVVDKDEGIFILRVLVALGPSISRAKIAFRVVIWKHSLARGFLCASIVYFSLHIIAERQQQETYCHGRLVRWGETRIQLPLRGL